MPVCPGRGRALTATPTPPAFDEAGLLLCCACHEELALPGAFCCARCCAEPEPLPVQPSLWEAAAA